MTRKLRIQLPADQVERAVESRVKQAGSRARIPGFRPGKAPLNVLYQRYGDQARREVAGELLQQSYGQALDQTALKPAGRPQIEFDEMEPGQGLEFTATFDVFPEIELKGLDKLKVEKPVVDITAADIDRALDSLLQQHTEYVPVERDAREGDKLVMDFEGSLDGEPFAGNSGEDVELVLGEGRFLKDMEEGLAGHASGDSFSIPVAFPEDYNAEHLQGKTADFKIDLKSVAEPKLSEIDAEFLQKFGVEEGGEAALREKIKESLQQEAERVTKDKVKQQLLDAVLEANPIEVPQGLVIEEIARMRQEALQNLPPQAREDAEKAKTLLPDEVFKQGAERRVALGLLISDIIKLRDLTVDRTRVDAEIDRLAAQYGQAEEIARYYRSNPQLMQGVEASVLEQQMIESLLEDAEIKEVKTDFQELVHVDHDHDGHDHN